MSGTLGYDDLRAATVRQVAQLMAAAAITAPQIRRPTEHSCPCGFWRGRPEGLTEESGKSQCGQIGALSCCVFVAARGRIRSWVPAAMLEPVDKGLAILAAGFWRFAIPV
jgi:hypothetical protein